MNVRTLVAAATIGTLFGAPGAALAATASPTPSPSASPTPTPTPPPHAASCTDTSSGPYTVYGQFPVPATPNTTVDTTIQVFPDTADGRAYLAQQETQVRNEQAGLSPQQLKANNSLATATYAQSTTNAQSLSTLLARLGPAIENTTPDSGGNWSCAGISFATPLLLWTTLTTAQTVTVTPAPFLSSAAAKALGTAATQRTQTTQYYYARKITLAQFQSWHNANSKATNFPVPFSSWTQVATVAQPI